MNPHPPEAFGRVTAQRVALIRRGVPASWLRDTEAAMGFTRSALCDLLGIKVSTVNRKLHNKALLSHDESERLMGLQRLRTDQTPHLFAAFSGVHKGSRRFAAQRLIGSEQPAGQPGTGIEWPGHRHSRAATLAPLLTAVRCLHVSDLRRIWRIATEGPAWRSDDLSGMGAARDPGRWNSLGCPVVYASSSIALACLETLVHITGDLPLPLVRWLVAIDIPVEQWQLRTSLMDEAPAGWDSTPSEVSTSSWGDGWLASQSSLVAEVPSVIVPEEGNLLLNPAHLCFSRLKATVVWRWSYDSRLI